MDAVVTADRDQQVAPQMEVEQQVEAAKADRDQQVAPQMEVVAP